MTPPAVSSLESVWELLVFSTESPQAHERFLIGVAAFAEACSVSFMPKHGLHVLGSSSRKRGLLDLRRGCPLFGLASLLLGLCPPRGERAFRPAILALSWRRFEAQSSADLRSLPGFRTLRVL